MRSVTVMVDGRYTGRNGLGVGMWTEMNLGSNTIENVMGIVLVETEKGRKPLMNLEIGDQSQEVLLSIDVYDAGGNHVAKLKRNAWVFNDSARFEITTSPASLKLIEKGSGRVLVEANVMDGHRVRVLHGELFTPSGDRVEIAPDRLVFRGITFKGNRFTGPGMQTAFVISSTGVGAGA